MDSSPKKIKQLRRIILQHLDMMYPTGMQLDSLYRTVIAADFTYGEDFFKKDIAYLKEKGYIGFLDDSIGGASSFFKKIAKLTANGKEIAEKTQTDPALEI